jgi:hypothetical protein
VAINQQLQLGLQVALASPRFGLVGPARLLGSGSIQSQPDLICFSATEAVGFAVFLMGSRGYGLNSDDRGWAAPDQPWLSVKGR